MSCSQYELDLSAIENEISRDRDKEIRNQIRKKLEKLMSNPLIGDKKIQLKEEYAVKVNNKRIVILYHIDDDNCRVIFDCIGSHQDCYNDTF